MTNRLMKVVRILNILTIAFLILAPVFADNGKSDDKKKDPRVPVQRGAELNPVVKFDLSPPLKNIPPAPGKSGVKRVVPNRPLPKPQQENGGATSGELDPVMQMSFGTNEAPTGNSSFNGVGDGFTGPQGTHSVNVAPPDPVHDVGPNHIVQAVNSNFAVMSKTGTVLYGPVALNTLWSGFGGRCQSDNDGDPTINYDQIADRWVIMQFAVSGTPYTQCVAVSQTADPLGAWYRYSYTFTDFNDYPKVGIWPDGYYVTYNMFTATSGYGRVCALDRSKLLTGQSNSQQCFNTSTNVMGLLPSDMDGTLQPAAGSPNYVFRFNDSSNRLEMWKFSVNWASPGSSTFTGSTNISVAAFSESCVSATRGACIPQSGTTSKLEALADRLMNRVAYRRFSTHEALVLSHAIGGDTAAQVRWYELRSPNSSPTVFQSGTYAPDTKWRWMPSIAMDKSGNIAVGYSVSSSTMSPDIFYTGRESTDTLGTMGTEATMLSGVSRGSQVGTYGSPPKPLERWGDYAALVLDPSDDCTFWFTSEYLPSNGIFNWRTRIGSFKFASCGGGGSGDTTPPTTSVTAPSNGATVTGTITISANASDNVGVTSVDFLVDGSVIGSDSTSPYSISWNTASVSNGSHVITSRAYDAAANSGTSSAVNVTVSNPGSAAYDSTLKAPKCATAGSFCDSESLLNGRNGLGPEPNQPNTINNSCADGSSGSYHSDESLDRLRISTQDGGTLATGKTVTIEATVWAWSTGSSDRLDLYYAADANSPNWIFIATLTPPAGSAQTLTASYTLPTGSLQAIRGNFRYNGSASSCSTGGYDDHDDLIFAVSAGADTTAPTTSITAPASGASVTGTITVSATASDNVGVTNVEFYLDGSTLLGSDSTSPYSTSWNTSTATPGSHTLTSKAYDAAGNTGTSSAVSVTVVDQAAPTTSITSPSNGASVSNTITISATASDNVGVTNVQFLVDGSVVGSDSTSPYSISWNTSTVSNGSHSITSRAYDAAGNNSTSSAVTVTVNNTAPDTTPPTTSITSPTNGSTVSGTITFSATASDNVGVTNVQFLVDGSVVGSDSTSPYSVSWNTTTASNGTHSLTSRAYDAAGNIGNSSTVSVTVNNAGGTPALTASYDSVVKAPVCGSGGKSCDSGSALLNGRANISGGAEPNQPNTINNSCSDGASGTYHSDESIDSMKVETNDGTALAGGKTVTVSTTVWCWGTADSLDLYYANNTSSPAWTLIGTQTCDVSGAAKTFTATYSLPTSGTQQAVRGNFRYQGSQSSCSTGNYDDHDDLVFGVQQSSDTTPPTTSISSPTSGSTVSGTITVSANASDNVGVTQVEFYVGGTLIGTDTTSPYSVSWNTTTVVNGSHSLTSKAFDAAGNIGTSTAVNITVNNTAACSSTSEILLNPGFESGNNGNWTIYSSKGSTTLIRNTTERPPHSGTWYTWLNGWGSSATEYIYQQFTIPSTACSATLSFWVRIDTAETTSTSARDTLKIEVRNSANSLLSTLATYSNLNANSTYVQKTFDLTAYKGQTIRIRFYGKENNSRQTSFVIDDTSVEVTQ